MRVKNSHGGYRYPKNTMDEQILDWQCLRQTRLLSGHHPDTGEKMTAEEVRNWNRGVRAANE